LFRKLELPQTFNCCNRDWQARGRHLALDADIEGELLLWIETNAAKSTAVTARDFHAYIGSHYNIPVSRGWVNAFVGRHLERVWKAKSLPQEVQRLEIARCFLDETIQYIAQFLHGRPAELVCTGLIPSFDRLSLIRCSHPSPGSENPYTFPLRRREYLVY
jgi:hypothetical protein